MFFSKKTRTLMALSSIALIYPKFPKLVFRRFFGEMTTKSQYYPKMCNDFLNFDLREDAGDGHRNENLYIIM